MTPVEMEILGVWAAGAGQMASCLLGAAQVLVLQPCRLYALDQGHLDEARRNSCRPGDALELGVLHASCRALSSSSLQRVSLVIAAAIWKPAAGTGAITHSLWLHLFVFAPFTAERYALLAGKRLWSRSRSSDQGILLGHPRLVKA
jgi:hypothetical protein